MSRRERLVRTILGGRSDANIRFDELRALMRYLGFDERVRGSHHLFDKEGVVEIVNLQRRGGHAGSGRLMFKYEIILYWSNEDEAFVAEAPELPGCMAHGADQETALENIKDAMRFWIDRARELGRPVPEPKGERLMLA